MKEKIITLLLLISFVYMILLILFSSNIEQSFRYGCWYIYTKNLIIFLMDNIKINIMFIYIGIIVCLLHYFLVLDIINKNK